MCDILIVNNWATTARIHRGSVKFEVVKQGEQTKTSTLENSKRPF